MTMTDTEAKALANRMRERSISFTWDSTTFYVSDADMMRTAADYIEATEALHAAELREQAERFSEALKRYYGINGCPPHPILAPFILPAPDPLVEVLAEAMAEATGQSMTYTDERDVITLRQALADRGYKIERIEQ